MRDQIRYAVLNELDIPPLPEAALRVQSLAENPKATAKEIASVISTDATLTALLLKQANSPLYGFPRKIGTVSLAVVVLGFDTVREISLATTTMSESSKLFSTNLLNTQRFWSHCLAVAVASRIIATKWRTILPGEAFVSGLLHDIGRLVLSSFWKNEYKEIAGLVTQNKTSVYDAEIEVFNTNHAEVAGWLAERWRLPEHIINGISGHHKNTSEMDDNSVRTVALANKTAHRAGFRHGYDEPVVKIDQELMDSFAGFNEAGLIEEIKDSYQKAESLLDLISTKN